MYKFFYLFLIGGVVSVGLAVYDIVTAYPNIENGTVLSGLVPAVLLFYMAYKAWHEKNDQELM